MAPATYQITVTYRCKHESTQDVSSGTEQVIREVAAKHNCQSCLSQRVDPIRFAPGYGWRTGR